MYCSKCGCKVESSQKNCPNCGALADGIEYCGGFWGLVGEEPKKQVIPELVSQDNVKINNSGKVQIEKLKRKYKSQRTVLLAVIIIFLVVSAVQTVRLIFAEKNYEKFEIQYQELQEDYNEVTQENEQVNEQYQELQEDYNEIVQERKVLNEQIEEMEEIEEIDND